MNQGPPQYPHIKEKHWDIRVFHSDSPQRGNGAREGERAEGGRKTPSAAEESERSAGTYARSFRGSYREARAGA
jgi:hypothetical protein